MSQQGPWSTIYRTVCMEDLGPFDNRVARLLMTSHPAALVPKYFEFSFEQRDVLTCNVSLPDCPYDR